MFLARKISDIFTDSREIERLGKVEAGPVTSGNAGICRIWYTLGRFSAVDTATNQKAYREQPMIGSHGTWCMPDGVCR